MSRKKPASKVVSASGSPVESPGHRSRGPQRLAPQRSLWILSETGLSEMSQVQISPERVGWKAFGITALPETWAPAILMIDSGFAKHGRFRESETLISRALAAAGIDRESALMVRSSGTAETLPQRGRLQSSVCRFGELAETIDGLDRLIASKGVDEVHWIVQQYHPARAKGHFSNERRVSYEKRDWVVEVEPRDGRPGYSSRVAVRQWRDGITYAKGPLACSTETGISVCLKRAAMWAHRFSHRVHFEWVWDGIRVVLVQADREVLGEGVNPLSIYPETIPVVDSANPISFRIVSPEDYSTYGKLRNAKLYRDLGYEMPPFYVLDDPQTIASILDGLVPSSVTEDLIRLTVRPLIIRTDGQAVPSEMREMLPRSDELRSVEDAKDWLTGQFRKKVIEGKLQEASLALIAHHFIPSVASAWARSEPDRPIVRIESLWGIPEGLYWFSHDTHEVDTGVPTVNSADHFPGTTLPHSERLRYKGTFVAPDAQGRWIPRKTARPYDWGGSVRRHAWLSEIAWTTRRIAAYEQLPVSVMWFLGNHHAATKHAILPWYHTKSDLGETPKAAPRRKYRLSSDFKIETRQDWEQLVEQVRQGKHIERVIVEPSDPTLIREPEFAKQLGELAKAHSIVVEISGGVLSHVYYILHRSGARVECVDLFGGEEDTAEFGKLVRDKVSDVIIQKGERAQTVQLKGDALIAALKQKLVEEALEALDTTSGEDLIGELADVLEVINGLSKVLDFSAEGIEAERVEKYRKRGGFELGIMLIRTATPRSVHQTTQTANDSVGSLQIDLPREEAIEDPDRLPSRPIYRRPDLRQPDETAIEKMLTLEAQLNQLREVKESLEFSFPGRGEGDQQFALSVELRRVRGALRIVVRFRKVDTQLRLPLDNQQLGLFTGA